MWHCFTNRTIWGFCCCFCCYFPALLHCVFMKALYVPSLFLLSDIFYIYISNVIPFPDYPSKNPLSPPPAHQPTYSYFLVLAFPYTGALSLLRTKGLSSHWCLTRPSSATNAARAMSPTMCFLWWFNPRELWRYWLVHIVVPPIGLQIPSAPSVLSLAPPLGALWSIQ